MTELTRHEELILNAVPDGICHLDSKGVVTFMNRSGAELLGYSVEELLGKSVHDIFHRSTGAAGSHGREDCAVYGVAARQGLQRALRDAFHRKDGTRFSVEYVTTAIRESGALHGLVVVFRDVSERDRAEEELLRLASFPRQAPNPILEVSLKGALTYVNAAAVAQFPDLLHAGPQHPMLAQIKVLIPVLESGEQAVIVRELKVGTRVYEMHVSYIPENHAVRIFMSEITERKRLEQLKNDLISSVSHEIRTPLTIIQGAVANLKDGIVGPLTGDQQRVIETTNRNCDRLARIINDILDFSRLESGKAKIKRGCLEFVPLAQEVLRNFEKMAQEKKIRFQQALPQDLPAVYADADMVAQILTNLLSNALRYGKEKVCVRARSFGPVVQISIVDDGPGIPVEDRPKLFNKFEQLRRPMGGAGYKGTGLGLAICKDIVDLHQGKIWVESVVGQGSQFHVTLPIYDRAFDFRVVLSEALAAAREKKASLALLVLLVGPIKELREQISTEDLDRLFRSIEQGIRKDALRKQDHLHRHTQNEFVMILEGAGREEAQAACERIHNATAAYHVSGKIGRTFAHLSVGMAVFPQDATDADKLLELATGRTREGEGESPLISEA